MQLMLLFGAYHFSEVGFVCFKPGEADLVVAVAGPVKWGPPHQARVVRRCCVKPWLHLQFFYQHQHLASALASAFEIHQHQVEDPVMASTAGVHQARHPSRTPIVYILSICQGVAHPLQVAMKAGNPNWHICPAFGIGAHICIGTGCRLIFVPLCQFQACRFCCRYCVRLWTSI